MHQSKQQTEKFILLCLAVLFSLFAFSGCQSLDKNDSTFHYSVIDQSQFEYDEQTNTTTVIWATTLTNNTIYNFDRFQVQFKLYNSEGAAPKIESYDYALSLKHGDKYTGKFNFVTEGKVNKIEYVSWTANYESFWDTYSIWIIVSIVVLALGILIYTIWIFVADFDLDDIVYFIWIPIIFAILSGGSAIWGFVTSNWVNFCIIACALIAFIILALIVHLIKFLICDVFDL